MESETKKYDTRLGSFIEVDISKKTCEPFGLFAGNEVKTPGGHGIAIGVVYVGNDNEMWFIVKGIFGAVFWGGLRSREDFEKAGFEIL